MELWQMDVMGGVLLQDDTELKVITGVHALCLDGRLSETKVQSTAEGDS
jgi:hypothetical protein